MYERIPAFVVAERSVETMIDRIENENLVHGWPAQLQRACKSELERHVESCRRTNVTEIVNRHTTRLHEFENADEPTVPSLPHFQNTVRFLAKKDECSNERDEKRLVCWIKRAVNEDALRVGFRDRRHLTERVFADEAARLLDALLCLAAPIRAAEATAFLARRSSIRPTFRDEMISEPVALLRSTFFEKETTRPRDFIA